MILFRKIPAYPLTPETGSTFAYLGRITKQEYDPPSFHPGAVHPETPVVMHSTLRRAAESLHRETSCIYIPTPELNEVPFSLVDMCSETEWEHEKSVVVRRRFIEAFTHDRLPLSHRELEQQLRAVLLQALDYPSVTLISHSFRLKLLQGFLMMRGRLFTHPEDIRLVIDEHQKTFGWGEGFETTRAAILEACST